MTTIEQNTVQVAQPPQEAKVRVTMETSSVPMDTASQKNDTAHGLRQILGSLADARKYIPNQVYTFLDSMEGKTIDDLRVEAMQLASKAQDEAKKRAGDVSSYGKDIIDTANQRVHDVADVARDKTNTYIVQPPMQTLQATKDTIQATKEKSKSLAQQGIDMGTSLTFSGLEKGAGLAYQGVNMVTSRFVLPVVAPVAERAIEYLPAPAKTFYSSTLAGKTLDELRDAAIMQTRKNLLAVKENNENVKPSLQQIAGELKDATFSGALLKNALQLTEKAADSAFGPMEMPTDASFLRRTYALGTRVTGGVRKYANDRINMATQQALDMASNRADNARGMVMQRANQVQESVLPIAQRIGATPVVPGFLVRMLRQPEQQPAAMQEQKPQQPQMLPATTIRVDIVGTQPTDAPQATSTTSKSDSSTTPSTSGKATADFGVDATVDAMRKPSPTDTTGNTNAQGMGSLGDAGMGVTTTGSESTATKPADFPVGMTGAPEAPQSTGEIKSPGGSKNKQHKKHSNKL